MLIMTNELLLTEGATCAVTSVRVEELPESSFRACCDLWARVFAKPGRTVDTMVVDRRDDMASEGEEAKAAREECWHLVWENNNSGGKERTVVAAARSFRRAVTVGDGHQRVVLGLAHVASDPSRRGVGLGGMVVKSTFGRLASPQHAEGFEGKEKRVVANNALIPAECFFFPIGGKSVLRETRRTRAAERQVSRREQYRAGQRCEEAKRILGCQRHVLAR